MKFIYTAVITFFLTGSLLAQNVESYFKTIRKNEALLTAFFQNMPKGGDLHHHYSGSLYAETYIEDVIKNDFWINRETLEVRTGSAKPSKDDWTKFSVLKIEGNLPEYKQKLMEKWSVKDYNGLHLPQDKHFFETFGHFGVANGDFTESDIDYYKNGLLELKRRAITEHLHYIETAFTRVNNSKPIPGLSVYNEVLRKQKNNPTALLATIDSLYKRIEQGDIRTCATKHAQLVDRIHQEAGIDDEKFTMRYQTFATRISEPVSFFTQLIGGFISADLSKKIVGVNILAPEDNDVSMQDYQIHMYMFQYCKQKFPKVKTAMHAGELTLGLVKPEDLSWHITNAVTIAGANRIGHGVDIAYESDVYALLKRMKKDSIAIEISLTSNEFILKVKDDRHPISLYQEYKVPIVISTDDAGVLRTNITEEFVLLAKRYPEISYQDIKQYVSNSIVYSFIEEPALKAKILKTLADEFNVFESRFGGK
jgi:adenosine deaminase